MKIRYKTITFDLPHTYDLNERLELVKTILDEHKDIFYPNYKFDNYNINKLLDTFSYYLVTSDKYNLNGKVIRKDSNIIRSYRDKNIKDKELPIFDFCSL